MGASASSSSKSLTDLADEHGTDKGRLGHAYTTVYSRYLDPIRQTATRVLEIGVYRGASIRMWRDYFPNANVLGVDHNLANAEPTGERTELIRADQTNVSDLRGLVRRGPFDVIVDDGSHFPQHQMASFDLLFPALRPGGYYFCEDLQAQFWGWGNDNVRSQASFDHFTKLALHLQVEGAGSNATFPGLEQEKLDWWQRNVEFVHFYRWLVVIGRAP